MSKADEHICEVCGAQADRGIESARKTYWVCSGRCLLAFYQAHPFVHDEDLTAFERKARKYGAQCGGKYLESIGCFDMSQLNKHAWMNFYHAIFDGYREAMVRQFEAVRGQPTSKGG